ncbi:regulation of nuclear pre-mRNA domain-containing protein 2-like [Lycorma delicatula]|uniref:regulation of nuclear pre-mRNA domain-containing protein 2-like n=1 Tax=Lycorma delicatula TaxID=130591 RepID=UPI003F5106A5
MVIRRKVLGDDKVRTKVLRLFTIWNERNIYDESFLVDLVGLLSSRTPAQAPVPDAQDFQPSALISKVRSCKTLEDDTDLRLKIVNESHLQLSDADALRSSLKDRRHGEDVVAEVENGIDKMEAYIKALELEIKERQELIELLDLADVFYETQKGEARIVCNEKLSKMEYLCKTHSSWKKKKVKLHLLFPTLGDIHYILTNKIIFVYKKNIIIT